MGQETEGGWVPSTVEERGEVLGQLNRILADSHFSHSKRYPHFLRYVVEETLRGAGDQLKERNLGIIIFDRPPDYDTNADSIVRVTAAEIRRRIAQYYDQTSHYGELRIDLPSGSYAPHFSRALPAYPERAHENGKVPEEPKVAERRLEEADRKGSVSRRTILLVMLALVSVGVGALVYWVHWGRVATPSLSQFWNFEGSRQDDVQLCIGQIDPWMGMQSPPAGDSVRAIRKEERLLALSDAAAAITIASTVTSVGLNPSLIGSHLATFVDLQREPTVLIGAFDNDWTQQLTEKLPYRLERPNNGEVFQIVETAGLNPKVYQLDMTEPYTKFTQDYGIVARFVSNVTNQPTIVVAGLASNGTAAASKLVTSEGLFAQARRSLPNDWQKKNLEIVVATQVIGGRSGPPKILEVRSW